MGVMASLLSTIYNSAIYSGRSVIGRLQVEKGVNLFVQA